MGFKCPFGWNVADFILDLVSMDDSNPNPELLAVVSRYLESSDGYVVPSSYVTKLHTHAATLIAEELLDSTWGHPKQLSVDSNDSSASITSNRLYAASFPLQLKVMLYRNFLNMIRNPMLFWVQLIIHIIFGVITGSIFSKLKSQQESENQPMAFGVATLLFWIAAFCAMLTFSAVPQLIQERVQYDRERQSGLYGPTAYFIAKTLTETLFYSINAATFVSITYWWVGLHPEPDRFVFSLIAVLLFTNVSLSTIAAFGAVSPNVDFATALVALLNAYNFLFSGFLISKDSLPEGWKWCWWTTHFQWGFTALAVNEFGAANEDENGERGQRTLEYFSIGDGRDRWVCLWALLGFVVFWRILGFLALADKKK
jgi:ABC-type multidrug transport system permease subunit